MTAECVPKVSVMIWGCITWNGVGTLCQVNGNINAEKYISVLDSQLWLGLWRGISMITTFMVWYGMASPVT